MKSSNNSDKLDDFLKRKLDNIEKTPSKKSWKIIREQLNASNRATFSSYAEGFTLICLTAFLMYWFYMKMPAPVQTNDLKGNAPIAQNFEKKKASVKSSLLPSKILSSKSSTTKAAPNENNLISSETPNTQNYEKVAESQDQSSSKVKQISINIKNPLNETTDAKRSSSAAIENQVPTNSKVTSPIEINTISTGDKLSALKLIELSPLILNQSVNTENNTEQIPTSTAELSKDITTGPRSHSNHRFHGGLAYTFNNTWILNQNTYGDFYGSKLDYKVNFGSAYGFLIGYDYKEKFGIQAEFNLKSLQGQKYDDVLRKTRVQRVVDLQYSSFPVVLKYRVKKMERQNFAVNFNLLTGLQYDLLRHAEITVNDKTISAEERFNKEDLAGIVGMEANVFCFHNFYLTLGGRGSISSNINSPEYPVVRSTPVGVWGYYTKSHNMLLGLNASVNYYFGR